MGPERHQRSGVARRGIPAVEPRETIAAGLGKSSTTPWLPGQTGQTGQTRWANPLG